MKPITQDNHELLKNLDIIVDFVLNVLFGYISFVVTQFVFISGSPIDTGRMLVLVTLFSFLASILYNYNNVYLPMRVQTPLFFIGRIFFGQR